ncbi:tetratricopeptide repeat protein [bacterium]|nr:tetratricopeptide repeat protein [candidate division CSSED10-310 bacterium]
MKRAAMILIMMVLVPRVRADESYQALFSRANRHYEAGDYQTAGSLYRSLERQGCRNARVYYNLGNCHLKQGSIGEAILYYRRALRIDPRDGDIRANLELARSTTGKPIEPVEPGFIIVLSGVAREWVSDMEITVITLLFYLSGLTTMAAGLITSQRRLKRRFLRWSGILGLFFLLSGCLLADRIADNHFREWGVILKSGETARNGPGNHFAEVFTMNAGYECRIIRHQSGWVEIVLANGYTGWIPVEIIEVI